MLRKHTRQVILCGLLFYTFMTLTMWNVWRTNVCQTDAERREAPAVAESSTLSQYGHSTSRSDAEPPHIRCKPRKSRPVDCRRLFRGDPDYIKQVKSMKPSKPKPDKCSLETLVKNCTLLKLSHGYFPKQVSKAEGDFPVAFAIKMHTAPYQTERLLRAIYMPHNFYCIHIDANANQKTFDIMRDIGRCFDNVAVLENRIKSVYASTMLVKAELECMKRSMNSTIDWKYYINLTGQEFPLRTNLEIVEILKLFKGANDIEAYKHPKSIEWRFKKRVKIVKNNLIKTNEIKPPFKYNIQMYKGSAYGMFSREFVDFILHDDVAQEYLSWMNDTYSPEENVWSTLNYFPWAAGGYSGFETRHDTYTHASKAVIWSWDKFKCHGSLVRSVCVFGVGDLPWLKSRPEVTANKLKEEMDPTALDCLEEVLRERTASPDLDALNWHYYRNLPQVKYYWQLAEPERTGERLREKKKKWLEQQEKWREVQQKPNISKSAGAGENRKLILAVNKVPVKKS